MSLGKLPYTAQPVSRTWSPDGSSVTIIFELLDASTPPVIQPETVSVEVFPEGGLPRLYDELRLQVQTVQITQAGGFDQFIEAAISQGVSITI